MSEHKKEPNQMDYVQPSEALVEVLDTELQNMQVRESVKVAGAQKYKRKNPRLAKSKHDHFKKLYQGFVDLIYFLEYIEDNPELHEMYEATLKELFGLDEKRRYQLFNRFLSAALFNKYPIFELDFRVDLAFSAITYGFSGLERGLRADRKIFINKGKTHKVKEVLIPTDLSEIKIFEDNVRNAKLWGRLIASRHQELNLKPSRRKIYSYPHPNITPTYIDRLKIKQMQEFEEDEKRKKQDEKRKKQEEKSRKKLEKSPK